MFEPAFRCFIIDLFIKYVVFRKSLTSFYVQLYICIYIYIIRQVSLKYVVFESTLLNLCKPLRNWTSNASQGQHIRKDATEQIKNLTLARTRSVGRSNFVRVCINLTTLIQKRHI